jgi:hypothetical protein
VDEAFASLAGGEARHVRFRHARSALADQFFASNGKSFANRTGHALLLALLDFVKERVAHHRQAGDLNVWLSGLDGRAEGFARSPLVAATLDLVQAADAHQGLHAELPALIAYLFDTQAEQQSFDSTLYALLDFVQVLRDDTNTVPTLRALSRLIAPNTPEAVEQGASLDMEQGALQRIETLLREVLRVDGQGALPALLSNLVTPYSLGSGREETPLEAFIDVSAEVNRARPGRDLERQLQSQDFRAVFGQIEDFLLDERRGLERVYDLVQARNGPVVTSPP